MISGSLRYVALAGAVLSSGCASVVTPTKTVESAFVIYDVKPTVDRNALMNAIVEAVQTHNRYAVVDRGIPPAELPEKPGRFKLVNPFAGTGLGALAASQGGVVRVAVCDDPLLQIKAGSKDAYGNEGTSFTLCLFPYREGYRIDIYATFEKYTGLASTQAIAAQINRAVVGDSSQFIPRAMNEVRLAAEKTGATVTIVDSYIPDSFKGAFVDQTGALKK